MTAKALEDLTVLDLSEHEFGGYCGKLLGAYGAEVIKVESPQGDQTRREGPFAKNLPHSETSAKYSYLNTNKLGITLDLTCEGGRKVFADLVKKSDALVEDRGPAFLSDLGLDPARLREWNPQLVTASISYFGESGPYLRYRGTPLIAYALGGYMYLTGEIDREPLQGPGAQPEYAAGLHGAMGVLGALFTRELTGMGQHIEVPIFEVLVSLHQYTVVRFNYTGDIQQRSGNKCIYPSHPITIYACRDGHVAMSPSAEDQGERLLYLMDKGELLDDPRFRWGPFRLQNADAFDAIVEPWFRERSKHEVFQMCQEWRVPCGVVNNVEDLLEDPHHKARHFWTPVEHPVAGTIAFPGAPFRMSETPWTPGRAPLLGEHNQDVFAKKLGYSADDLVRLRQEGVI